MIINIELKFTDGKLMISKYTSIALGRRLKSSIFCGKEWEGWLEIMFTYLRMFYLFEMIFWFPATVSLRCLKPGYILEMQMVEMAAGTDPKKVVVIAKSVVNL